MNPIIYIVIFVLLLLGLTAVIIRRAAIIDFLKRMKKRWTELTRKAKAIIMSVIITIAVLLGIYVFSPIPVTSTGYEDLTTFALYNPNSTITVNATRVTWIGAHWNSTAGQIHKSYGAGHFDNFTHWFDVNITQIDAGDSTNRWMLRNLWAVGQSNETEPNCLRVVPRQYGSDDTKYDLVFQSRTNDANDFSVANGVEGRFDVNSVYYFKTKKTGSTMRLDVYSTAALREAGGNGDEWWTSQTGTDKTYEYVSLARDAYMAPPDDNCSGYIEYLSLFADYPWFSNVAHNTTQAGAKIEFSCYWEDYDENLDWCGFTHNNTASGSWISNVTKFDNLGADNSWANHTTTLLPGVRRTIGYRWFCNDTVGNMGDTGINTLNTEPLWWDRIVSDAQWGWSELLALRDDFYGDYGNITGRYLDGSGAMDTLFPILATASLDMYLMTENQTYLDYARSTIDDAFTYCQNSTTKLMAYVNNDTGLLESEAVSYRYLDILARLAFFDSSYEDEFNEQANAVIQYNIGENDNYNLPVKVNHSGSQTSANVYWYLEPEAIVSGMLWGYLLTNNSTYLDTAREIIVDWWAARDQDNDPVTGGTQLVPDSMNTESLTWVDTYTRQYCQGSFLRLACYYYYVDGNSTIYDIINNSSQAVCNYIYDGSSYDYRTDLDMGTATASYMESNWPTMDQALQMAYEIVGNSTFITYALENYDRSFQDEGYNLVGDVLCHGTDDSGGGAITDEGDLRFGFQSIMPSWSYWQAHGNTTQQGDNRLWTMYNKSMILHTPDQEYHSGDYGYFLKIIASTGALKGGSYRLGQPSAVLLPWLEFYIRPSSGVNITWVDFPNKELYRIYQSEKYLTAWSCFTTFLNVTFNYASKTITFDKISGAGTITFNQTIYSATRNGVEYTDFDGNNLTTVSGSYNYTVTFETIYEDFEYGDYVETDPNSHIAFITPTWINATVARNEDAMVYRNFTGNELGNFTHEVNIRGGNDLAADAICVVWMVANETDDYVDLSDQNGDYIAIYIYDMWTAGGASELRMFSEINGGASQSDSWVNPVINTWYYLTIIKEGTNVTCHIYSDADRQTLADTINITMTEDTTFPYLFGCNSYNSDAGHTTRSRTDIKNLLIDHRGVTLNSPGNATSSDDLTVTFGYTPVFYETIVNASVWTSETSWSEKYWDITVQNNTVNNVTGTFSTDGTYLWNVKVYGAFGSVFATNNWTITVYELPDVRNVSASSSAVELGDTIYLWAEGNDEGGLGYAFLSTNETGTWLNYTESFIGDNGNDHVLANATIEVAHAMNQPAFTYVSSNDTTYLVYQGADLDPYAVAYNHTSDTWSSHYKIGNNTLVGDTHGTPVISMTSNGYFHVFYGCHNTEMNYSRSTNPYDITAWTDKGHVGDGTCTYPKTFVYDGKIFVVTRHGAAQDRGTGILNSTDNGDTWSSTIKILDGDSNHNPCYGYIAVNVSAGIMHITWTDYEDAGTRKGVYYAYYNLSDYHMYNVSGSDLGVGITQSEFSDCEIYYSSTYEAIPTSLAFDENNYPHVVWGVETGGTPPARVRYSNWNGSGWTTWNLTDHGISNCFRSRSRMMLYNSTDIELYQCTVVPTGSGNRSIYKWRFNGSDWFRERLIMGEAPNPSNVHTSWEGNQEFKYIVCEIIAGDYTGASRLWAMGNPGGSARRDKSLWAETSWTFANFTWSNSSSVSWGDTIQWKIYFVDVDGYLNSTATQSFTIGTLLLANQWNSFNASTVDITQTLGEINASIWSDGITFTIISKYNGTYYTFIRGYQVNANIEISATSDTIFVYCTTTGGVWTHEYP